MAMEYGLIGAGANLRDEAMRSLESASKLETERDIQNKQIRAGRKQASAQVGATVGGLAGGAIAGAEFGEAAGPWGALIGAVAGGLFGSAF